MSSPITGFSGFNSGLPIDDIIAKLIAAESQPINLLNQRKSKINSQKAAYASVQSKVTDLLTAIKKLTTRKTDGSTLFDAFKATSSDEKIATATATASASPQSISLEVKTLPSATKALSATGIGNFSTATVVDDLDITAGSFKIYVEGTAYDIAVNAGETMGDVLNRINSTVPDAYISANPTIVDGKVQIAYLGGAATDILLGSGGDTSNFLSKANLLTAVDNGTDTIGASQRVTLVDTGVDITTAAANTGTLVTAGTFTINGESFDTTGKTLSALITEINASDANVTAKYNRASDSFELVSKDTGSSLISLADGTSNFLTAMNLIVAGDTTVSQTAGNNTEIVLNGTTLFATSSQVDETVTGLTGVTLDLKKAEVGTTIDITLQKDKDTLKTAIKDVIDKYNTAISFIDTQTNAQAKGILAGETRLTGLRNQIRSLMASGVGGLSGTAYDSLQRIGIGTTASTGTATATLSLNETTLLAALDDDPETVEKLFVARDLGGALNGTANDDGMDGTFTRIGNMLLDSTYTNSSGNQSFGVLYNGGTDTTRGLFASYTDTVAKRISDLDKSIERITARLEKREKMLRQQFLAMDKLVGQFQSQGNAITGLMNQFNNK